MTTLHIGRGSFADVYDVNILAYKTILDSTNQSAEALKKEYEMHMEVFDNLNSDFDPPSLFQVPRPRALYLPATGYYESPVPNVNGPYTPIQGPTSDRVRWPIGKHRLESFSRATYAMDRIPRIPHEFLPLEDPKCISSIRGRASTARLCQLHFGGSLRSLVLTPTSDFPLDLKSYTGLWRYDRHLPSPEEIVKSMGRTLALIHGAAQYDGRGIKFVVGSKSGVPAFYVFDFDKMRPWNKKSDNIEALCSSFYESTSYPRPDSTDHLYQQFKQAYKEQHLQGDQVIVEAFFEVLEATWASRCASCVKGILRLMINSAKWATGYN